MKYLAVALLLASSAHAEAAAPCTGFTWPMAREVAAAEAAPAEPIAAGTTLSSWPQGAVRLALTSGGEVTFPNTFAMLGNLHVQWHQPRSPKRPG